MVEQSDEKTRAKTIIGMAIRKGKIQPVVQILQQLLNVNEPIDEAGSTTLMLVAGKGTAQDLQQILAFSPDVSKEDSYGRTAIHFACRSGNQATFGLLSELEDIEVNCFTNAGVTPLMMAVQSRHIELVAACLRSNCNPFLHDALGHTAMDYANFGREKLDNDISVIID